MSECTHIFGQLVCYRCGMSWYGTSFDYVTGAAVAFGLMGMAEAIRTSVSNDPFCDRCIALEAPHHPECIWNP